MELNTIGTCLCDIFNYSGTHKKQFVIAIFCLYVILDNMAYSVYVLFEYRNELYYMYVELDVHVDAMEFR